MKYFFQVLFAALLSHSAYAQANLNNPVDFVTEPGICTRDFNPWGHAGSCSCADDTVYEQRLGVCLAEAGKPLEVEGQVQTGVMAIGGETTGYLLLNKKESFELVLSFQQQDEILALEGKGLSYKVKGDLVTVPGVEITERKLLLVDTIEVLSKL